MVNYIDKKTVVKEFLASGKSPTYFIDSYCKISHPERGIIPFKLWDFQQKLLVDFNDFPHNIILKSRQLGISWTTAAYAAWLMMFYREKSIMVIATKFKTAANLVKKVKFIIKNLPPWFDQFIKITIDNRTSFILSNGSEITAGSTTTDVGRSESLSLLIIDEAAHIPNIEELWTAAGPTIAAGGRSIALSSPYGVGTWFYNEYTKAEKGENEFHPIKLMWDVHPERDEEWERKERKKYSQRRFEQEFECSFLSSGETVIASGDLKKILNCVKIPINKLGYDRGLYIWENFDRSCSYILSADIARGDGADFSAVQIINLNTLNQVAEYKGKPNTDLFANMIYGLGQEYGQCMIIAENNNIGYELNNKLNEMGYPNLYWETKGSHEYVPPYEAKNVENCIPGFATSHKSRPLIISKLEECIRNDFIKINSERLYRELETFIWNKGRPEATKEHHDDLVMAMAIACWVKETALKENIRSLQYKRTFLRSMINTRTIFNTSIPGMSNYKKKTSIFQPNIDTQKSFGWIMKG